MLAWLESKEERGLESFSRNDVLLYTSTDGNHNDLTNVETAWENAKVVICSPTIVYGIDYNNKMHPFTAVMGFYTQQGFTMGAEKVRQQLRRPRQISKPNSQRWHVCVHIFSNPKQAHLKRFYPTDAHTIRTQLQEICASYNNTIKKIPITIDATGKATMLDDPLSRLYIEFLRKRNLSKFNLQSTLNKLLIYENHKVTTLQHQKLPAHTIWNSEGYMTTLHQSEMRQFQDAFDLEAAKKSQRQLRALLPNSKLTDKQMAIAVESLQDILNVHEITGPIIEQVKASPTLMQLITSTKFRTCLFRFQRLLRKNRKIHWSESSNDQIINEKEGVQANISCDSPVHITQSEVSLLQILQEVEANVLEVTRFECLHFSEEKVRSLYHEPAQITKHLLALIKEGSKYQFPPTFDCAFITRGKAISQYHVYQWVCKIYQHFCSTVDAKTGKRMNIIDSKNIPLTIVTLKGKSWFPTPTTKQCDGCNHVKDAKKDFYPNKRLCKDCYQTIQFYSIKHPKKQIFLIQLIQLAFFLCSGRNDHALHMSLRLDETIIKENLAHDIDVTLSPILHTTQCITVQHVIDQYGRCCIISEEE